MKKLATIILMAIAALATTPSLADTYNVRDFGATGDGVHIDSEAINKAIRAAAGKGGGTVYVPAGRYACYSIRMASHVELHLEQGAAIIAEFPTDSAGYDPPEPNPHSKYQDFSHSHWQNSLIWGIGLNDITISGPGYIIGKGLTREGDRRPGIGNKAIALKECSNVVLRDLGMVQCGHFALLATGVDNLTISNVKVDTNRDGFDIDCCKNVRINSCSVNSPWDDAIVLKASFALGYFKDTENVTISDCFVSGYDRYTMADASWQLDEPQAPDHGGRTGRIKIGTESSGGFKNIAITNCLFEHCRGLAIESVDGGDVEDVVISNITMRDIVNAGIFLRLGARMRSPEGTPVGSMKRIHISHVNAFGVDSRYSSIISGVPGHKIEDVSLSDISLHYKGGFKPEDASNPVPEQEKAYPEPWMFGTVPAKGFYVRHAEGIRFDNISFHFEKPDSRPLFVTDDADGLTFSGISEDGKPAVAAGNSHPAR